MNELMSFEGHKVEILEIDGQILFNPYHVGVCLDLSDSAIRNYTSKMNENQVIKLTNSNVRNKDFRKLHNTGENFLTESGVYKLVFKSRKPDAEKFTDWIADEVLPSIRKTGTYTLQQSQPKVPFTEVVQSIAIISKDLNINDASKLLMYDKLYSSYGVSTEFLPKYENNGSREIRPATELLKRINSNIKTAGFNQLLIKNGYLEERTRKSTKSDELRYFKALTEKGLQYGENLINQKNQREVQPYYYTDTFQELYDLVTAKETILV